MKKLLACLALMVMVTVSANAQHRFSKGDWITGAQSTSLDFESSFNKSAYDIGFNISALGGWFFADKFAVDLMAGVDYQKSGYRTSIHTGLTWSCAVNFGTGMRYYPVANLFVRVGYSGQVWNDTDLFSYLDAKVGYDLFLSEKVFFEPAIYYGKNINSGDFRQSGESVLGLSLGFGVRF